MRMEKTRVTCDHDGDVCAAGDGHLVGDVTLCTDCWYAYLNRKELLLKGHVGYW